MKVYSIGRNDELVLVLEAGPVLVSIRSIKRDGSVEIQIEAPRTVPIHRREVYDAIFGDPLDGGPSDA